MDDEDDEDEGEKFEGSGLDDMMVIKDLQKDIKIKRLGFKDKNDDYRMWLVNKGFYSFIV